MGNLNFSHGGNIDEIERKYGRKIIDFSANINLLGLPVEIKKLVYKNFNKVLHYPDPSASSVTKKIAKYWRIKPENILVGNGSAELIYLVTYVYKPKTALIPVPAFSEYERAARSVKCKTKFLKLKEEENFKLNLPSLSHYDIVFLCNPNNPTGNLVLERARIKKLPAKLLLVDEAFMDFLPDERNYTLVREAVKNKKIIVIRTFTKFFALPGLRIGYLIGHKDVISALKRYQSPWSTNIFAQLSAEALLSHKTYIKKTRLVTKKERDFLFKKLTEFKCLTPFPSEANFLLIKIENEKINAPALVKKLIKEGIFIRDCSNFRALSDKYVRVAVRSHKENLKLLVGLKKTLKMYR